MLCGEFQEELLTVTKSSDKNEQSTKGEHNIQNWPWTFIFGDVLFNHEDSVTKSNCRGHRKRWSYKGT